MTPELIGTAVVTGAARGIGRRIASRLRAAGHALVLVDRDPDALEVAAASLTADGPGPPVRTVPGDVVDPATADEALRVAGDGGRPVAVLVNNAGIGRLSLLADMSVVDWDDVVDVSLKGTFLFTRAFARVAIPDGRGGCVVNLSSLNAVAPTDGFGAYCAAKAGVSMLTQVAASELGPHGIRVNAVAPGKTLVPVDHDPAAGFRARNPRAEREFLKRTPLGRLGTPDDIAAAVEFLCSSEAGWITGVTLSVDGGNHVRGLHSYWDLAQPEP
jgi:glucose 1-dehydrogenase